METINVGKRIKSIRKRKGLTLQELAEKSGISATAISAIERNVSSPTVNTLAGIARVVVAQDRNGSRRSGGLRRGVQNGRRPIREHDGARLEIARRTAQPPDCQKPDAERRSADSPAEHASQASRYCARVHSIVPCVLGTGASAAIAVGLCAASQGRCSCRAIVVSCMLLVPS